jgi:hypothetical protein
MHIRLLQGCLALDNLHHGAHAQEQHKSRQDPKQQHHAVRASVLRCSPQNGKAGYNGKQTPDNESSRCESGQRTRPQGQGCSTLSTHLQS